MEVLHREVWIRFSPFAIKSRPLKNGEQVKLTRLLADTEEGRVFLGDIIENEVNKLQYFRFVKQEDRDKYPAQLGMFYVLERINSTAA